MLSPLYFRATPVGRCELCESCVMTRLISRYSIVLLVTSWTERRTRPMRSPTLCSTYTELRTAQLSLSCSSRRGINLEQGPRKVVEVARVQHLNPGVVGAIEPGHCTRAPRRHGVVRRTEPQP